MFRTILLENLSLVTGGCPDGTRCFQRPPVSHEDQLKNGNGGIVPKLPPLSHADQLKNGNGGIVPKL